MITASQLKAIAGAGSMDTIKAALGSVDLNKLAAMKGVGVEQ